MPCASCGGGRVLSPNKPSMPVKGQQSPQRIVVTPKNGGGGGGQQVFKPNGPKTKRTQI